MNYDKSDVDGESNLVVVHVDKAIGLFRQLVALCDVAVPGVTWLTNDHTWCDMDYVTWIVAGVNFNNEFD